MKSDSLIVKRLQELEAEGRAVASTRRTTDWGDAVDTQTFYKWATSALSLLARIFGTESDHYRNFRSIYEKETGYASDFDRCHGILEAASADYRGGYLFKVRSLVRADVVDTVLEQAQELLKAGHKDPSCVVAGVALESALKELCHQHTIPQGKLDKMNADLAKTGVYNVGMQKQVTAWAHWRNRAAHGEWGEYGESDVADMIAGVRRFISEHL